MMLISALLSILCNMNMVWEAGSQYPMTDMSLSQCLTDTVISNPVMMPWIKTPRSGSLAHLVQAKWKNYTLVRISSGSCSHWQTKSWTVGVLYSNDSGPFRCESIKVIPFMGFILPNKMAQTGRLKRRNLRLLNKLLNRTTSQFFFCWKNPELNMNRSRRRSWQKKIFVHLILSHSRSTSGQSAVTVYLQVWRSLWMEQSHHLRTQHPQWTTMDRTLRGDHHQKHQEQRLPLQTDLRQGKSSSDVCENQAWMSFEMHCWQF